MLYFNQPFCHAKQYIQYWYTVKQQVQKCYTEYKHLTTYSTASATEKRTGKSDVNTIYDTIAIPTAQLQHMSSFSTGTATTDWLQLTATMWSASSALQNAYII